MTIGLNEGHKGGKTHGMEEVEKIVLNWRLTQKRIGRSYTPGKFDYNTMLYEHDGCSVAEPVAIYKGELSPLYNVRLSDKAALAALIELAELLAKALKQPRIYLTYRDLIFTLENKP
jgi:hypothetical protein